MLIWLRIMGMRLLFVLGLLCMPHDVWAIQRQAQEVMEYKSITTNIVEWNNQLCIGALDTNQIAGVFCSSVGADSVWQQKSADTLFTTPGDGGTIEQIVVFRGALYAVVQPDMNSSQTIELWRTNGKTNQDGFFVWDAVMTDSFGLSNKDKVVAIAPKKKKLWIATQHVDTAAVHLFQSTNGLAWESLGEPTFSPDDISTISDLEIYRKHIYLFGYSVYRSSVKNPLLFELFGSGTKKYQSARVYKGDLYMTEWEFISTDQDINTLLVFQKHPKTIDNALRIPLRKNMGASIDLVAGSVIYIAAIDNETDTSSDYTARLWKLRKGKPRLYSLFDESDGVAFSGAAVFGDRVFTTQSDRVYYSY